LTRTQEIEMPTNEPAAPGRSSRRQFVQGLLLANCAGGSLWRSAIAAQGPELSGSTLNLVIDSLPVNLTGRNRLATAANGSLPAPILRMREGDTVTINVTNRLTEPTSLHWHGLRLPADQDGVPGLTFRGIPAGATFTYRFPVLQAGTYWYHSHSGMQEQTGLYGPLILVPRHPEPYAYDREYVIMLSDWTDEEPMSVAANLKQQSDYYNYQRPTVATLRKSALQDRFRWARMRMSPTDIMDVTGSTYTFLVNGQPPAANWTGLFTPGEKLRLRFINGSSMTTFDVRIPGLSLTVVAADGSDIEPVVVEEFRVGVAETYDVIVEPRDEGLAYTVFAQAQDRSGFARATLAPRAGMSAAVPPLDPRPLRTTADMGMASTAAMAGMDMSQMSGMDISKMSAPSRRGQWEVDNIAAQPTNRLAEAGTGLDNNGRRVLVYADLKALNPDTDTRPPTRDLEFHLTGNMERWVWGFDGRKFSEVGPIRIKLGERVRFVLINDTMMEHPIHLHGFLVSLENGRDGHLPLKHTINVKPGERLSFIYTADTPGHWAFHCHLLYHMETGMFRTVLIA
jgi:FtsP/CotA-like multicopper oxidase with cupredoxin domain